MLKELHIQNFALIERLDADFHKGFSVITGETGAGKSILLGAIGLLLGQRADSKSIRTGAQRCTIEATFDVSMEHLETLFEELDIDFDGTECILRRELTAAGKSRAFINDTPASVTQLKSLGERLIDIHSQHQNLLLQQEDFQLNVLDILAKDRSQLADYQQSYNAFKKVQRELQEATSLADEQKNEQDYLTFQLQQLEDANLQEGEDIELEQEQQTLEHAEEIKSALYGANELLNNDNNSILQALRMAHHQLEGIASVFPEAEELAERIESSRIELKDIADELEDKAEGIDYNPERQAVVEERLSLIYELERKHHVETLGELIELTNTLRQKLDGITHSDERIAELTSLMEKNKKEMVSKAKSLSLLRHDAAKKVEKAMVDSLVPLGMQNVRFTVQIEPTTTPDIHGLDKVTFLFNANKNATMQPISQIASGGEIARVMLSLKALISGATQLPTIIFDEIDTGVSGQIAERMALMMKQMGDKHQCQVISITHLPQIAALGQHHYRVYKEDIDDATNSHITELTENERIEEIAHMLSGATLTEAALNNARTLLMHNS